MQKLIMTNVGRTLITKLIAGTSEITFTQIKTSDYEYTSDEIPTLIDISQEKQIANVSSVSIVNSTIARVRALVNNTGLATGYYVKAVGLYAKDTSTNEEILFGVSLCDNVADYMPAQTVTTTGISYTFNCKVENTEQVDITVNPASVTAMEDFEELDNRVSTHIANSINTSVGVHGLRYQNEKLEYYNDNTWNKITNKLFQVTVVFPWAKINGVTYTASFTFLSAAKIESFNQLISALDNRQDIISLSDNNIALINGRAKSEGGVDSFPCDVIYTSANSETGVISLKLSYQSDEYHSNSATIVNDITVPPVDWVYTNFELI